ncbi:hypothetical protein GCM10025771_22880 [Niveibacterium umoris]|uniref:Uncharacterized protein n=1 Tax=Niveibacterium umoris TaxID=1193620 RepID=A0A840BIR3_9RHOO|nr:hypothetical protein [Niveibacterium umoris]MBB4012523.1 hypothetical protein [Niveibacterium umoris]
MLSRPKRRVRPTPTIMMWALVDVAGVLALALGAGYLAHGRGFFFDSVPASTTEALLLTFGGLATIVVAAIKMLAEVLKQMPQEPPAA